jgi:RNA polymerase sigma factor (sigma-70 family)
VSTVSATTTGGHDVSAEGRPRGRRVPARLYRLASDERLVEALRGGSEAAFEVIYTRHHRGVLSFCRHMLGSVEEAEDVVQYTFLAAYRDLRRTSRPMRLRPWLYTIARNRCLSVLRARRERPSGDLLEPATENLSHEVERRDDLRAMLGDLADLPADQRAALVLAELGDMSHDEIGAVLGRPREKVKALVFQARSSLIASRTARETPCEEIRAQLANLRGGALRRNTLRRHLRECEGCREFRDQVVAQRSALALILPVAPTLGLKAAVLGAAGVTAAAGGGSASVVASTVVALCVAGGGTAAVDIVRDDDGSRPAAHKPRSARTVPAAAGPPPAPEVATPVEPRLRVPGPDTSSRPSTPRQRGPGKRGAAAKPSKHASHGPKPKAARPQPGTGNGSKPSVHEAKQRQPAVKPRGHDRVKVEKAKPEKSPRAEAAPPAPPVKASKPGEGPPPHAGGPSGSPGHEKAAPGAGRGRNDR